MTIREHVEQLKAMLIFNIDETDDGGDDCYDTAELLDELSTIVIPGDYGSKKLCEAFEVYDIAFRAGIPFTLTEEHQRLILGVLNDWLEE